MQALNGLPTSLLFACSENSVRSPMAEALAKRLYGQAIYVDPTAEMVIARFSSHPVASNAANDATSLPAYEAVARYLMERAGKQ